MSRLLVNRDLVSGPLHSDTSYSFGHRLVDNLTRQLMGTVPVDGRGGSTFTFVIQKTTRPKGKDGEE